MEMKLTILIINCFVLGNNRSVVMVGERRRCLGIGGEEGERDEGE